MLQMNDNTWKSLKLFVSKDETKLQIASVNFFLSDDSITLISTNGHIVLKLVINLDSFKEWFLGEFGIDFCPEKSKGMICDNKKLRKSHKIKLIETAQLLPNYESVFGRYLAIEHTEEQVFFDGEYLSTIYKAGQLINKFSDYSFSKIPTLCTGKTTTAFFQLVDKTGEYSSENWAGIMPVRDKCDRDNIPKPTLNL